MFKTFWSGYGSRVKKSDAEYQSTGGTVRCTSPDCCGKAAKSTRCRGHESNLKLYRVVDIVSAFLALPPPVAEGEMDAHERKAWYQSERERLKFEQETAQLIPASDVRREFAIWAKAVVQVLETLPDILERDCGLQPAAVSRVQSIIDDLRDQIALRVTEAGADDEEELQQEE